jgi:methionyl aminopeptidase
MIRIKTKEDIAILREGGKRHAEIMRALVALVKPGVETIELDRALVRLIEETDRKYSKGDKLSGDKSAILGFLPYGADRAYPASICISVNDEVVHGIPTENNMVLEDGDVVSLDFALIHNGMVTDMAVTVPVGDISPELVALLETTKKALMAGIKAVKAGVRVGDVSTAIERVGRAAIPGGSKKGYGIVEELVGHGVGYSVHEPPYVPNYIAGVQSENPVLPAGTVIAIEPMFNLGSKDVTIDDDGYTIRTEDGMSSAHFEHTVLVTKGGAEILTA